MEERRLRAVLCAALPALRERAEAGLWTDELAEMLDDLAAGEPVVAVCKRLGLLDDDAPGDGRRTTEHGVDGAHLDGLAPVVLDGDYRCPGNRCPRRAHRDDRGRVPVCGLAAAPMTFRSGS